MRPRRVVKKICILGDPAVGKTSLVGRFVLEQFGEEYISTIGARVCEKQVLVNAADSAFSVQLVIWDIAGQNQFTSVTPSFYRGAEGALIVCDPTRRETFRNLYKWDHQFRRSAAAANAVILFNKKDIEEKWEVTPQDAGSAASQLNHPFLFTSAKTGHNVEAAFSSLAKKIVAP
jgi:small GTP-binding protein